MKKIIFLTPLILLVTISVHAQSIGPSTINATGGSAPIGGNIFDWSVGEMTMVSTLSGSGIIVTQGVLQPYDGPDRVVINSLLQQQLNVFPNPALSVVNLQYTSSIQGTLTYRLIDMVGQLIKTATIDVKQGTTTEQINISALASATYMLEVTVNPVNDAAKSTAYKIQKLQ